MAVKANIKIDGLIIKDAYISVLKKRDGRVYSEEYPDGIDITWVYFGGAISRKEWVEYNRFRMNHVIALEGELKRGEIYQRLKSKKVKIPLYEIDFTKAKDIKEKGQK